MNFTKDLASEVFDVLVRECQVQEHMRQEFVQYLVRGGDEFRFQGCFGFGGKLYNNKGVGVYVDYYPEHKTVELEEIRHTANREIRHTLQKPARDLRSALQIMDPPPYDIFMLGIEKIDDEFGLHIYLRSHPAEPFPKFLDDVPVKFTLMKPLS